LSVDWGKNILFLSIASFALFSSCQKATVDTTANPTSSAIRFYGNNDGNLLFSFEATPDGGYMFGGATNNSPSDAGQGFIQKTDKNGNVVWYKNYGGPLEDLFMEVHATSDGGFIGVGATNSYGHGATRQDYYWDAYMVKTDANGDTLWQKTFGGIYADQFFDVAETPDKGFVAVGFIDDPAYGDCVYIVKTDQNGNKLWTREYYQGFFSALGASVAVGANGDIAVAGYIVKSTLATDQGIDYPSFILLSPTGVPLDKSGITSALPFPEYKSWGGLVPAYANSFRAEKIISQPDGYIFAVNLSAPQNSLMLFKVDITGNILWNQQFKGLSTASMNDAVNNPQGGLLISGVTVDESGKNHGWMLNTDPNGNRLWETDIPVQGFNAFAAGVIPVGSSYAMGVNLSSTHLNIANFFGFLTTDQNGNILGNGK